MKLQNTLLGSLGRSLSLAMPEVGDSDMQVPAALLPTIEAAFTHNPFVSPTPGSATDTFPRESFWLSFNRTRAAAAANEDTVLFCLSEGIWQVSYQYFATMPAAFTFCGIGTVLRLINPSTLLQIGDFPPRIGTATGAIFRDTMDLTHTFNIPLNQFIRFTLSMDNTGAATSMNYFGMFNCRRLG